MRLTTLVNLRWLAILGQSVTVIVSSLTLELDLALGWCALVITLAAIANLMMTGIMPANARLSEREAFGFLLFDVLQLTALLFLTGGLNNPFALLFLAPVTISATALSLRSTLTLAALAIALISLLGGYYLPLQTVDGRVLALPPIHLAGFWFAIVIGTLFLSSFAFRLTRETEQLSNALFATQTALAREQQLYDLGGVIAAAAHELGTPLATIKLVSSELAEELADRPDLREDAELVRGQADRCRDILRSMGRAGKSDHQLRTAPVEALLREAAVPHDLRGKQITYELTPLEDGDARPPQLRRMPEIIHGLRNLIQNAVDFARHQVWIDVGWTQNIIIVRVSDDGDGYPHEVLPLLGDPFLRSRNGAGLGGMGLGLFISKTLLERTGAVVTFANGSAAGRVRPGARAGAIVEVRWPRAAIAAPEGAALGDNTPLAE